MPAVTGGTGPAGETGGPAMAKVRARHLLVGAVLVLTSLGATAAPSSAAPPSYAARPVGAPTKVFQGSKAPSDSRGAQTRAVGDVTISSQGCTADPVAFGGQTSCRYAVQNQTQTPTTVDLQASGDAELAVVGADQGATVTGGTARAEDVPLPPRTTSAIQVNPGTTYAGYYALSTIPIAPQTFADDELKNYPVPEYRWNGATYTSIGVSANGYTVVGGGESPKDASASPQDMPNAGRPNNVLAPFWTDLTTAGGGAIRIATVAPTNLPPGERPLYIVVEWEAFEYGTTTMRKAQVWIRAEDPEGPAGPTPAEEIYFTYDFTTMTAAPARPFRIGAENSAGTVGGMRPAGQLPTQHYVVTSSGGVQPAPVVLWDVVGEGRAAGTGTVAATVESTLIPGSSTVFTDVTVSPEAAPVVTDQPDPTTVRALDQAVFSAAATGATSVRWQVSTDDGGSWDDVPGATATTLAFATTGGDDGKWYRAVFASGSGVETATDPAALTITPIATVTSVQADPAAPDVGESVTFVSSTFPANASGSVQFAVDGNPLGGPVPLVNGTGTSPATSSLSVGDHTVTATYSGDLNHASSTGTGGVSVGKVETSTALSFSPPSTYPGQDVTATATVSPSAATGTVTFTLDGDVVGGPVALSGGTASVDLPAMARGTHVVVATYSGDTTRAISTSGPVTYDVVRRPTTTTVTANPDDPDTKDEVVVQAEVEHTDDSTVVSGGTVSFFLDGNQLGGPVALAGGVAHLPEPLTDLDAGPHTLSATYSGADVGAPSTSADLSLPVTKVVSSTDLYAVAPDVLTEGDPFTALLSVAGGATGNGTVQLSVDGTDVGAPVAIGDTPVTVSFPGLAAGDHTLGAAFSGDDDLLPSDTTLDVTVYGEDEGFVRAAFPVVLGRSADDGAVAYWVDRLEDGMAPAEVARRLALSAEGRGRLVDLTYQRVLGRSADGPGRAHWSGRLAAGLTAEDLLAHLLATGEAYQRAGSSPEGFAIRLYQVHLGRNGQPAGVDHWTRRIEADDTPGARRSAARAFGRTSEATRVAVRTAVVAACGSDTPTDPQRAQLTTRWAASGRHPLVLAGAALALVCKPGA